MQRMTEREKCFRELLERNHARWTGIARCYAGVSERDDLIQEILLQIWKSLDRFAGRSSIDTWAYRVALNTALAWDRSSRKRAARFNATSTPVDHLAGQTECDSLAIRVLDEFLASLSKTDRAVMLLMLDDVPSTEAAEIIGITDGAYRVRLHRIRLRFEAAYCERGITNDV